MAGEYLPVWPVFVHHFVCLLVSCCVCCYMLLWQLVVLDASSSSVRATVEVCMAGWLAGNTAFVMEMIVITSCNWRNQPVSITS